MTTAPSKHDMKPMFTDAAVDYKKTDEVEPDDGSGAQAHIGKLLLKTYCVSKFKFYFHQENGRW